ncbi:MAG: fatty acid cis/trans isomerase, partial [Chromatiaceae bacterium]|nr:fatty acid cis/trans isomerase [Chromatiaceae bacterium]
MIRLLFGRVRRGGWLRSGLVLCALAGISAVAASADGVPKTAAVAGPDYKEAVQPIFNRRCIACHGCLGSPCNVKLDSFRGVDRGGFALNPYSSHFGNYPRIDMEAADSTAAWRQRGFYPILARDGAAQKNLDGSLLYQMVAAGMRLKPGFSRVALDGLRPDRYRAQCAATPTALSEQLKQHQAVGMPFGLPAISAADFATLKSWVAAGSPGPDQAVRQKALEVANPEAVAAWEAFLNGDDQRTRLVSRYIFQHVFLATIVLTDSPGDQFRLVRSSTPPVRVVKDANASKRVEYPLVEVIGTGLPYDDPYSYAGVDKFWYRLEKRTEPPVQKNHFVWRLAPDDIAHLTRLFAIDSGAGWDSDADMDPRYGIENPFYQFAAIPAESRYRFILENSEMMVGGITYGPVCNGQTATYAVKDQFWVFFLDPAHDPSVQDPLLGLGSAKPLMDRSVFGNAAFLDAFAATKARLEPKGWSLDAIWDGDGDNENAWLTVLRHETNVSVLKGARGGMPRSLWLVSYAGFERMYYDTVAGFAYWEGDPEKLETLLFFNFLRQSFEDNILLLLPEHYRQSIRDRWTRGIGAIGLYAVPFAGVEQPARVAVTGEKPLDELVALIARRLGPAISGLPDPLNPRVKPNVELAAPMQGFDDFDRAISTLTAVNHRPFVHILPSVVVLRLNHAGEQRIYSLVANHVYESQYTLLFQNGEALPNEDTLSVYRGLVNGFPNLFVDLGLAQAPGFLTDLSAVKTEDGWHRLESRYAIRRNSERFWLFYDWLNDWSFITRGDDAGWLDLTYY